MLLILRYCIKYKLKTLWMNVYIMFCTERLLTNGFRCHSCQYVASITQKPNNGKTKPKIIIKSDNTCAFKVKVGMCGMDFSNSVRFWKKPPVRFWKTRRFGFLCRSVVKYNKCVSCFSCVCILHFGRRFSKCSIGL